MLGKNSFFKGISKIISEAGKDTEGPMKVEKKNISFGGKSSGLKSKSMFHIHVGTPSEEKKEEKFSTDNVIDVQDPEKDRLKDEQ